MIDKRRAILSLLDELFLKVSPKFNYINGINCWPLFKIQIGYLLIFLNDDGFNKKSKETRLKFNKIRGERSLKYVKIIDPKELIEDE